MNTKVEVNLEEQIIKDYEYGISIRKLEEKYNISRFTLSKFLKEKDIKVRPVHESNISKVYKDVEERIVEMYTNGISTKEIREQLGLGKTTVHRILKKNNIDTAIETLADRLTPFIEDIIKLYKSGIPSVEIAKKYNTDRHSFVKFLHIINVDIKRGALTGLDKEIISKYLNGQSANSISKEYNVTIQAISYVLKKNNIEIKQVVSPLENYTKEIIEKYNKGFSTPDIAKEYNIGSGAVLNLLRRNKIERRKPSESKKAYLKKV